MRSFNTASRANRFCASCWSRHTVCDLSRLIDTSTDRCQQQIPSALCWPLGSRCYLMYGLYRCYSSRGTYRMIRTGKAYSCEQSLPSTKRSWLALDDACNHTLIKYIHANYSRRIQCFLGKTLINGQARKAPRTASFFAVCTYNIENSGAP